MSQPTRPQRLQTLDGIRGIAAVFVVIGHADDWLRPLGAGHFWLAVDLFFLMSGFVIGRVYEPRLRAGMGVAEFMTNRYVRLYPLYALGLAVAAVSGLAAMVYGHAGGGAAGYAAALASGLLMLPSPTWQVTQDLMPLNYPAWSLVFELLANLVFAAAWRRLSDRVLLLIVAASFIMLVVGFQRGTMLGGEGWPNAAWGLPRIGFAFFLGVLMQRHHRAGGRPGGRRGWLAWAVIAAPALVMALAPARNGDLLDLAMLVVIGPVIVWVGAGLEPRRGALAGWLGDVSYPMYVLHMPLRLLVWRGLTVLHHPAAGLAPGIGIAYLALLVGLSWWLDRHYDRPVRRWFTGRLAAHPRRDRRAQAADRPL